MSDGSPDPEKHFKIKNSLLRYFGTLGKVSQQDALEDDILTMVNEGQENGVIQDGEAKMISNIFALNDKDAGDIMTHRSQITGIDSSMPLQDALNFMLDANNSRFPVYNKNMDHIIGILHLKDVCRINRIPENREKSVNDIPGLLREVLYIAETKKIDSLFREMQKKKIQMVIVIDEYGQTAGLVAMEDILEEIVGNIQDEYDDEEPNIVAQGNNRFVIDGMSELEDLEERFGISFYEDEYDTLNGFLISKMDRIPDVSDRFSITVDGYCFQIIKVKNHRIDKVLVYQAEQNENQKQPEQTGDSNSPEADTGKKRTKTN